MVAEAETGPEVVMGRVPAAASRVVFDSICTDAALLVDSAWVGYS